MMVFSCIPFILRNDRCKKRTWFLWENHEEKEKSIQHNIPTTTKNINRIRKSTTVSTTLFFWWEYVTYTAGRPVFHSVWWVHTSHHTHTHTHIHSLTQTWISHYFFVSFFCFLFTFFVVLFFLISLHCQWPYLPQQTRGNDDDGEEWCNSNRRDLDRCIVEIVDSATSVSERRQDKRVLFFPSSYRAVPFFSRRLGQRAAVNTPSRWQIPSVVRETN